MAESSTHDILKQKKFGHISSSEEYTVSPWFESLQVQVIKTFSLQPLLKTNWTQLSFKRCLIVVYVVVQFYSWLKILFSIVSNSLSRLPLHQRTKENRINHS